MAPDPVTLDLGRPARALFRLREDGSFLNHGSYGACPRAVQAAQDALRAEFESHPDAFMARLKPDGEHQGIRAAAAGIAALVGSTAEQMAFVENATSGVQTALNAMPLRAGDEVLATDHQYNAVRLAIEARCAQTGAVPRVVALPLPTAPAEILQRVLDATGPRTRLAVLDHLTSPSALLLPVEQLTAELRRRGIRVLVDGAHAVGQLPLDLPALGADWYVSNGHKWLYTPRGTAFLHVAAEAANFTRPLQTSHYIESGFPTAFDYIGTRDYTAWLAVPAALQFVRALGSERLHAHNAHLIDVGSEAVAGAGALPVAPRDASVWMRAFILPQHRAATNEDAAHVIRTLWERERIQIRCAVVAGRLLLRFCAQAYVAAEEMQRLGEALRRHGWPDASPEARPDAQR
jgi:isopenicillin-N epimerase